VPTSRYFEDCREAVAVPDNNGTGAESRRTHSIRPTRTGCGPNRNARSDKLLTNLAGDYCPETKWPVRL
jgi:hypothetical protein